MADDSAEFAARVAAALSQARELETQFTAMRDQARALLRRVTVMELKLAAARAASAAGRLG